MTNQLEMPEALRLAEHYDYGDPIVRSNAWKVAVCNELRRQHTRIVELEAQIEADPKTEPVEPDPADIIAGALQISRGHAIEIMREALEVTPQQAPVGEVQHLHELNDSWLNKLPVGTKLYTAPQQKPSQDTMYLLRRLLSNQHTLTGSEFRAELEKIVGEAYQQEVQEPLAWTPGPNLFKDWCAQWFGPDSDDEYLAKAVFNLPPMAQVFKETVPQKEAQELVVAAVFDEQLGRPMLVEGAPMLSHGQPLFTAVRARLEENITHN